MELLKNTKLILASASERRYEILLRLGIGFTAVKSLFDEENTVLEGEPFEIALESSYNKAMSIKDLYSGSIILAADTIVVYNDRIFGKPRDEEEARYMLGKLSSNSHDVITGFTVINTSTGKVIKGFEKTKVFFSDISGLIDWYISSSEYCDKAGAYGIQGKGAVFVNRIEGCYFNVVGLPIHRVVKSLREIM